MYGGFALLDHSLLTKDFVTPLVGFWRYLVCGHRQYVWVNVNGFLFLK